MERFVKGDIVVIEFPFSDLTEVRRRPAIVIQPLEGGDIILCQITGQEIKDRNSILIREKDFQEGRLKVDSLVRFTKLFTGDNSLIYYKAGHLKKEKMQEITEKLCEFLRK